MAKRFGIGILAAAVAASSFSAPALAGDSRDIVRGGLIGAAGGAAVGALVPGVSVGTGALVGGLGGAAIGAVHKKKRYYSSSRRSYWVDRHGRRHYR